MSHHWLTATPTGVLGIVKLKGKLGDACVRSAKGWQFLALDPLWAGL